MKLNVKKSCVMIFVLTFLLALTACGNGQPKDKDTTGSTSNGDKEVLSVWLPATAKDGNDDEIWNDLVTDFKEENNVDVDFQFISWKDYEAKFASGISTGTGPDVARMYVEMFRKRTIKDGIDSYGEML